MKTEFVDKRDMINPNIRKNYRVKVNESAIVMEKEYSFYYAAVIENISMTGIAISVVNKCKLQEGMNILVTMCSSNDESDIIFEFDATVRYVRESDNSFLYAGCMLNTIPDGLQDYLMEKQLAEISSRKSKHKKNKNTVNKTLTSLKPGSKLIVIVPNGRTATRYTGHVINVPINQYSKQLKPDIPSCFFKYDKEEMFKINPKDIKENYVFTVEDDKPLRWDKTHIYKVPFAFDDKVLLIRSKLNYYEFEQRGAYRYKTNILGKMSFNQEEETVYDICIKDLSLIGARIKAKFFPKLYLGMKGTVQFCDGGSATHVIDVKIVRMEEHEEEKDIGCVITDYHDDMGMYLSSIRG